MADGDDHERPGAQRWVPDGGTLPELREAVQACRGCELYRDATQAVLGEGPKKARLVLLGEQPGDQEDRQGRPFVGPAGQVLVRALADAGIDRADTYRTNVVKHFRWRARGKQRIHQTPTQAHATACRPWLVAELDKVVLPYHLDALKQAAGLIALDFVDDMERRVSILTEERGRLDAALRELPCEVWPSAANFILFRPTERDATEVWQALVDRSVLVRNCSGWPGLTGCLRVTIGTRDEDDRFLDALSEVLT